MISDIDGDLVEAIALKVMLPETKARIRAMSFGERVQLLDLVREALDRDATSQPPRTF